MTDKVSKQDKTRKWVKKFCELMDWFIGLEKVDGDTLMEAHVKGLAANYLAVKLGIFDETKLKEGLDHLEWDLPFRGRDWQCDFPERLSCQERMEYRRKRMEHWKAKAETHGHFKQTRVRKKVTPENVRRFCDCLRTIPYRVQADPNQADVTDLALEANDLAVELGLTHPDWVLAMNLGLLSIQNAKLHEGLPLPRKCAKPPVIFSGNRAIVGTLGQAVVEDLDAWIKKAESLSLSAAKKKQEEPPASARIPPKYRSAPLSLTRMADLWGGDMTAKKLSAMVKNQRIHVKEINRQTFVFDTRDLPGYVCEAMRK